MNEYLQNIRENEGTSEYQTHVGTATSEKFLPYIDTTGNWTIGYGHKLSEEEIRTLVGDTPIETTKSGYQVATSSPGWSYEEAEGSLSKDYNEKLLHTTHYFGSHSAPVMHALTEFGYNIGAQGIVDKFPAFSAAIESGDYSKAAENLIWKNPENTGYIEGEGGEQVYDPKLTSKWYQQVGHDRAMGIYDELISGAELKNDAQTTDKVFNEIRFIDETNLDSHKITGTDI
jgi:GH24 family phage-related lysozyme (muramidase)